MKAIFWLSESGREAELTLSSGGETLTAFCQPCELSVGSVIIGPLHAFDATAVERVDEERESVIGLGNLRHRVTGKLIDAHAKVVTVGGFSVQVDDYMPGGIEQGDYITFECVRIDVW